MVDINQHALFVAQLLYFNTYIFYICQHKIKFIKYIYIYIYICVCIYVCIQVYVYMYISVNSNVFLYLTQLSYDLYSINICTVANRNIRNIHVVSTNQIAHVLRFNNNINNHKLLFNILIVMTLKKASSFFLHKHQFLLLKSVRSH